MNFSEMRIRRFWYFLQIKKILLVRSKLFAIQNKRKPSAQYFPVVLFMTMYKVTLTFGSVDEILKCDH